MYKYTFLVFLVAKVLSDNCKISWMENAYEVAESQYILELSVINTVDNLHSYFPNTYYDITIKSKFKNHTFTQFYFTIWNINKSMTYGTLELREKELSMFHNGPYCINRIIDGPVSLAKLYLKIGWQSPPRNSGCIELKAAVKETELRYHIANITVCEDPRVVLDDPGEIFKNCCACDEGKYELAFEGLWSRYTHPRNFPRREWLAVFPTIIGASHAHDYQFWERYTKASNGLLKFAETGYSVDLELELKSNMDRIRTLIKFRGVNFQNKTRKSFAGIRVNRKNHVVSLVARIEPSPDWFIGVSSLELCQTDCTWIDSKTLNLYAYDAGIRNGMLYEDLDGVTDPPDVIQSMNMTWPPPQGSIQSPFYDKTNNTHDIRPLARIHFTRLRGSEKSCQQSTVIIDETCVTNWSEWGECSVTCGTGITKRSRSIKPLYTESNCPLTLEESKTCQAKTSKCEKEVTKDDCVLTEWSDWTKCEKICGQEPIQRTRAYKSRENEEKCKTLANDELEEIMDCSNPPCPDDEFLCVETRYNMWSDWSACSVTQGNGVIFRYRTIMEHKRKAHISEPDGHTDYGYSSCLYEKKWCDGGSDTFTIEATPTSIITNLEYVPRKIEEIETTTRNIIKTDTVPDHCFLPQDIGNCLDGHNDNLNRFYYDSTEKKCKIFQYSGCGGNSNKFNDEKACKETCIILGPKIDCEMANWSTWSKCQSDCYISRERRVKVYPENGGKPCPYQKTQRSRCCQI